MPTSPTSIIEPTTATRDREPTIGVNTSMLDVKAPVIGHDAPTVGVKSIVIDGSQTVEHAALVAHGAATVAESQVCLIEAFVRFLRFGQKQLAPAGVRRRTGVERDHRFSCT